MRRRREPPIVSVKFVLEGFSRRRPLSRKRRRNRAVADVRRSDFLKISVVNHEGRDISHAIYSKIFVPQPIMFRHFRSLRTCVMTNTFARLSDWAQCQRTASLYGPGPIYPIPSVLPQEMMQHVLAITWSRRTNRYKFMPCHQADLPYVVKMQNSALPLRSLNSRTSSSRTLGVNGLCLSPRELIRHSDSTDFSATGDNVFCR